MDSIRQDVAGPLRADVAVPAIGFGRKTMRWAFARNVGKRPRTGAAPCRRKPFENVVERTAHRDATMISSHDEAISVVFDLLTNTKESSEASNTSVGRMYSEPGRSGKESRLPVLAEGDGIPSMLPDIGDSRLTTRDQATGIGRYLSKISAKPSARVWRKSANDGAGAVITVIAPLSQDMRTES